MLPMHAVLSTVPPASGQVVLDVCRVVSGVADLAQGKGPTITQAADGTLQVLTNNNSGDEMQLQRDGTLTYVNGGSAPGIFSVSYLPCYAHPTVMHCALHRRLVSYKGS